MKWSKHIPRIAFCALFVLAAACERSEPVAEATLPVEEKMPAISVEGIDQLVASQQLTFEEVVSLKWTLDGNAFWVQSLQNAMLYDATSLQLTASYDVGEDGMLYDVSPDGNLLAYALEEPDIILFDVLTQQETQRIAQPGYTQQVAFSPDGKNIGANSNQEWMVTLWDAASGEEIKRLTGFETAAPIYSFKFGSDGKTILWIARGTIQPMDIESGTLGPEINHEDFISCSALSPDGNLLATGAVGTVEDEFMPIVSIWDAHSGERLAVFPNADYYSSLNFSPDGSLLAAGSMNSILFFDMSSMQPAGDIQSEVESVNDVQFSPDGSQLLSAGTLGIVQLWQIAK